MDQWGEAIDGLGLDTAVRYDDFLDEFDPKTFEMAAYTDLLWKKVFLSHRPA